MLKNKLKMIVTILTIIMLLSVLCINIKATDDNPIPVSDGVDNAEESSDSTNINEDITEENEILYEDLYIFDNSVTMDKVVDGNVYIFGNNVTITGKVNGNLFVLGNEITFTNPYTEDDLEHQDQNYCYVAGSVFAFGNKISFNAVAQDIYAFGNIFDMSYDAYIMRDIRIAGSDLTIKGCIVRDAYLYADTLDFGTVSENEEENNAALIYGDLNYSSSTEAEIPDGIVMGETKFTADISSDEDTKTNTKSVSDYLSSLLSALIYTLVIYLLFKWLAPKFFDNTSELLKNSAMSSFGIGIIALLVTPIIALILLFTSFVSLSVTLVTVYGLLLAISFTVVAGSLTFLLKDKLGFADKNKKVLLLIIITIVMWALKQIPFVGPIVTFVISVFGLGLILRNIANSKKTLELKEQN